MKGLSFNKYLQMPEDIAATKLISYNPGMIPQATTEKVFLTFEKGHNLVGRKLGEEKPEKIKCHHHDL